MEIKALNFFKRYIPAAVILAFTSVICGHAQGIDQEVYVVRPYEPVVSDAKKINFLPSTDDISVSSPEFKYSITPKKIEQSILPEPVNPARMVAVSMPRIYNSFIKVGVGNYLTPMAEFNVSNLHSRDYSYGLYLYHKSSHSNIKLINGDKVPGGYADSYGSLYGKRMYDNAVLSGNLNFTHKGFNYYGYNTELFASDSLPEMERDSIRQSNINVGFDLTLASSHTDSSHLNYIVKAGYNYFVNKDQDMENIFSLSSGFNKNLNGLDAGIDAGFDVYNTKTQADTTVNTIIKVYPWIGKISNDWRFRAGFEVVADVSDLSYFYAYPRANLDIIVVKNVLVPFIGIDGKLVTQDYRSLFSENRFVMPDLKLRNTSHNFIAYGGIKGNVSNDVSFRADISYSIVKNMNFFINDTVTPLQNLFMAETDDVNYVTYHGQLNINPGTQLMIQMEGSYFTYNTLAVLKPWHKPGYEVSLGSVFKANDKLTFDAEAIISGNRWVKTLIATDGIMKLDPVIDINLKVNYRISNVFSVFFDIYNITGRSNLIWNQYPSQQFNFMGGLSYKL